MGFGTLKRVPLLTEDDYLATMGETREPLRPEDAVAVDLESYLRVVDQHDLQGHDFSARAIASAYSMNNGAWQHILFSSAVPNVFLVLVLDGGRNAVYGHHVLDLNQKYGLES